MHDRERTLAEVTKEARVGARLSMRGLARRSGLSAAQVSRIEAGEVERPAAETLVKLAKALDRDAQLLLFSPDTSWGRGRGSCCERRLRPCPCRAALTTPMRWRNSRPRMRESVG